MGSSTKCITVLTCLVLVLMYLSLLQQQYIQRNSLLPCKRDESEICQKLTSYNHSKTMICINNYSTLSLFDTMYQYVYVVHRANLINVSVAVGRDFPLFNVFSNISATVYEHNETVLVCSQFVELNKLPNFTHILNHAGLSNVFSICNNIKAKQQFTFSKRLDILAGNYITRLRTRFETKYLKRTTVVGIMADQISTPQYEDITTGSSLNDYFIRAINYFVNKNVPLVVFLIYSHRWKLIQSIIPDNIRNFTVQKHPEIEKAFMPQDLAIMSYCDHVALTTEVLGLWVGYLSKGGVVFDKTLIENKDWNNVIPTNWIPI